MPRELPPSGGWKGYYLYGHGGLKHGMRLTLTFSPGGPIDGDGVDDIAPFTIHGRFDPASSQATWTKTYAGMHTVEYSGIYCGRTICGDWALGRATGGFWIWPDSLSQSDFTEVETGIEQPSELVMKHPLER